MDYPDQFRPLRWRPLLTAWRTTIFACAASLCFSVVPLDAQEAMISADESQGLNESARKSAMESAQLLAMAFEESDWELLMEYTHPRVLEMLGGEKEAAQELKRIMESAEEKEIEIISYEVLEPGKSIGSQTAEELYVIIPVKLTMQVPRVGKVTQESYLLGVSGDRGETWTFVDGSGVDSRSIKTVLPNFNEALNLPGLGDPVVVDQ